MAIEFADHKEFLVQKPTKTGFWVHNLIPQGGVVLIWGYTSTGKSPISWHLAHCIATGTPFFYLPVKQGRVLYVELDTPRALVWERASLIPECENLRWAFAPALVPDTPDWHALAADAHTYKPDVVFLNTLRKAHSGSDIESHVPSEVYARYQRLFPGAAITFTHHARKVKAEGAGLPANEGFSGSQAWQNDAQVAARLYKFKSSEEGEGDYLALDITKSQVCPTGELVRMHLLPDGVNLAPEDFTKVLMLYQQHPEWSQRDLAKNLDVNQSTVSRAIKKLQSLNR